MSIQSRQAPATPLTTRNRADSNFSVTNQQAFNFEQKFQLAEVGSTVPLVFCKRSSGVGGTWVRPPVVRLGVRNYEASSGSAKTSEARYVQSVLLSQGQISTPISNVTTDVLFGGFFPNDTDIFSSYWYAVTYGSMPTSSTAPFVSTFDYGRLVYLYYDLVYNAKEINVFTLGGSYYYHNTTAVTSTTGNGVMTFTTSSPYATGIYIEPYSSLPRKVFYTKEDRTAGTFTAKEVTLPALSSGSGTVMTWNYSVSTEAAGVVATGTSYISTNSSFGTVSYNLTPSTASPITITFNNPTFQPYNFTDGYNDNATPPSTLQSNVYYTNFRYTDQYSPTLIREKLEPPFMLPSLLVEAGALKNTNAGDFTDCTLLTMAVNIPLYNVEEIESNDPSVYNSASANLVISTVEKQMYVFCSNGINVYNLLTTTTGPSNNFADLVRYMALKYTDSALVDDTALLLAAQFTNANALFFNGVITESVNIKEWITATAPFFLLFPVNLESQITLKPALPITGAYALNTGVLTPEIAFDEDTIEQGSYSVEYIPLYERKAFTAVVLHTNQTPDVAETLGEIRSVTVRYSSDSANIPQEQYDMSQFCATAAHATMFAKYILAKRRKTTHRISFNTDLYSCLGLTPGSIITVTLDRITSEGTSRTETTYYQITSITRSITGTAQITADHFPTSAGASVIATDIVSGSFTVSS